MSNDSCQPQQEALQYIITLCELCQERGGYTLEEAVQLHDTIHHIHQARESPIQHHSDKTSVSPPHQPATTPSKSSLQTSTTKESHQTLHIHFLFQLLEKSQKLGHLTLEEAWTVFNAQKIILQLQSDLQLQ